jgi:hypothetical protein
MRILTIVFFYTLYFVQHTNAQTATPANGLEVFVDCNNYGGDCYASYLRQEMNLITFVRDRLDADVHIIAKANYNNLGAQINTLFVSGQGRFNSLSDTLNYTIPPNSTEQEKRDIFTQYIKIALLPYLPKTALASKIQFKLSTDTTEAQENKSEWDPYNFWVFQLSLNGSMNGNEISKEFNASGYASADRETNNSKSNIYLNAEEQYSKYKSDGKIYQYEFQSFGAGGSYMKKLTEHIGAGAQTDFRNSLFSNLKYQFTAGPLLEFSIFPYKEFNTRRLVLQYTVDARHNTYYDTTIYLKTKELLFAQEASAIGSFTQKWGSVNLGIFWRNLFTDFEKNSLGFNGAITARLVKGLNFAIWGNYSFVRNQLNIRKGELSIDQLIAQNREILSAYNYNLGIGISYRFGSKFNNAVNPCFRGLNYNISL